VAFAGGQAPPPASDHQHRPPSRCWRGRPRSSRPLARSSAIASTGVGPAAESGLAHHRDVAPASPRADQGLHQPPRRPGQEPARDPPLPQAHPGPPALPTAGAHRPSSSRTRVQQSRSERCPAAQPGRQPRSVVRFSATGTSSSTGAHRIVGHGGPGRLPRQGTAAPRHRLVDLGHPERLRRPVPLVDERLHDWPFASSGRLRHAAYMPTTYIMRSSTSTWFSLVLAAVLGIIISVQVVGLTAQRGPTRRGSGGCGWLATSSRCATTTSC
jgi:hypothetical protein